MTRVHPMILAAVSALLAAASGVMLSLRASTDQSAAPYILLCLSVIASYATMWARKRAATTSRDP